VYLVRDGAVTSLDSGMPTFYPFGSVTRSDDEAVVVGTNGKLIFVDVAQGTTRTAGLGDWEVPKPGRDILGAFSDEAGTLYLVGKHQMLLRFDGRTMSSLVELEKDVLLRRGAAIGSEIVVSRSVGGNTALCSLSAGRLVDCLSIGARAPAITAVSGEFAVGSRYVDVGRPGQWRRVSDFGSEKITALVPMPRSLFAVSYEGEIRECALE